ncbi:MAG: aspartate carbamoyltransferase catalytic subunit [Actinobacteria bacterium]|nr:aspartate carbamoyltransferase catalytic subunit [Actinomycetota bacterium]
MLGVKNIIDIDDLSSEDIKLIMENADSFAEVLERDLKKVPTLRGKTLVNLFFEPSTRTRTSFEIAAKRLSADMINFSASTSSLKKGETIIDTVNTIQSMVVDLLIIRHSDSGVLNFISRNINTPVINAGDGKHQHPTQALLDLYTIKKSFKSFKDLKVALVGDIANSRVARSNARLFKRMGMNVSLVSAPMMLPEDMSYFGADIFYCIDDVIKEVDILYMLRMQFERQQRKYYPSIKEYNRFLSLNTDRFGMMKKGSIVMHPGPVNRGIEISETVMNLETEMPARIKINNQVNNGVAVRMALIYLILISRQENI